MNNGLDFLCYHIKRDDIANVIDRLYAKLSYGIDGIFTVLLKRVNDAVIEQLTIIVNETLSTGIFPDRLKFAKIIFLLKNEENTLLTNYRRISLFSTFSKIIERIIFINFMHISIKLSYYIKVNMASEKDTQPNLPDLNLWTNLYIKFIKEKFQLPYS